MRLLKNSAKRGNKRKGGSALSYAARWLAVLFAAAFLTLSLYLPESAGRGSVVAEALFSLLGVTAYLLPWLLFYGLYSYFQTENTRGLLTWALGSILCFGASTVFLATVGAALEKADWGGALGDLLAAGCVNIVGLAGTGLVTFLLGLLGLQILFEISWGPLLKKIAAMLIEDYRGWRDTRRKFKGMVTEAAKNHTQRCEDETPRIAEIPEEAKRKIEEEDEEDEEELPAILPPSPLKILISPAEETVRGPEPGPNDKPYRIPPLELLPPVDPKKDTGRPSETELQESKISLENVFANFKIDAKVTGICPGPVITRYEVAPAAGVKVNTVTARASDIALAMKARSIRIIAPIPGKAAIGIEVPNQRPAIVTLRTIMESDAMPKEGAPLAFALGLSSEGVPLVADIQKMPHVLVAGATNSGKSVMIHSIIASILFRQRPDQVKLVLIDPKRIELTLYDGIPHLYDPKLPPDKCTVITTAKKAAGTLKALVLVMEDRLEKYQSWKVQNIMQFNRAAAAKGEKGDFYIVVVIDELADLMIVSRDIVEDSVQRLTQMARAVGIHLVIATQRPSVDVVTGVIKANLPSRIAMRVASKVDSKVVLDGNGAESLLGRGDALYISAGNAPERIQGGFVSQKEIEKLVDFLKQQGGPDYQLLSGMISTSGDAQIRSKYGIDPLHFTKALKLIVQRKRVSQDILKAQFGSSARASELLNILELEGFIHKPEGTNKWTIQYEKIEHFIRTNYPQIDLDESGI